MSRSHHTTRRHLQKAVQFDESDAKKKVAKIEELQKELARKRTAKAQVKKERHGRADLPPTSIDVIPIQVRNASSLVHFPASPEDLRAVLKTMPAGMADGLTEVELSLGEKCQRRYLDECCAEPEPDPLVGRPGYQRLPGIYGPRVLGRYMTPRAKIEVYGYVYEESVENRTMCELYLRLHMLMTFLHELAHHYDRTHRIARGRWRADDRDKVEMYAEHREHEWICSHIIPYLENKYLQEMAELRAWLRHALGVEVPVALLAGEVRATGKNGGIRISSFFSTSSAFEDLVGSLSKGEDLMKARLQFARDLHYAEAYDTANAIIDTILGSDSLHAETMTLRADILQHQEKYQQALEITLEVLAVSPDHDDAAIVAADAYEGLKQWAKLREVTTKLLLRHEKGWIRRRRLQQRALACIELGDFVAAEADIAELEADKRPVKRMIEPLKARLQERMNEGGSQGHRI